MTYTKLKIDELRTIADEYAVDIEPTDSKATIIQRLNENGVTYGYYENKQKVAGTVTPVENSPAFDEPAENDGQAEVLLKMTRANGTFEVRGIRFTKNNPYAIVKEEDADYIIETFEGFGIATPKEVKEYYG